MSARSRAFPWFRDAKKEARLRRRRLLDDSFRLHIKLTEEAFVALPAGIFGELLPQYHAGLPFFVGTLPAGNDNA